MGTEKVPRFLQRSKKPQLIRWFSVFLALGLVYQISKVSFTVNQELDPKVIVLNALETNLAGNWSEKYTAEPHLAGTNYGLVEWTQQKFEEYGFEATIDPYEIYVSYPKDHDLNL
ncbi:uncharacterized protein J8A68_003174, partial [[Candida] subhashii]